LGKHNVSLDSSLDEQHIVDRCLLKKMIDLAEIKKTEIVLEVGAGCGSITEFLARRAKKVYAIEKSRKFLPILKDKLKRYQNVHVVVGDATKIKFPRFDKIVSNLPYSTCEALIHKLIRYDFRAAVFIVPMSFARTIVANPQDPGYSKLSMKMSFFYNAQVEEIIQPNAYIPTQKAYTALLRMTPITRSDLKTCIFQGLFLQTDKKMKNALRKALIDSYRSVLEKGLTKREAKKIIDSYSIDPRLLEIKVARLSLEEIREIFDRISERS